jgi:hypothetical protein
MALGAFLLGAQSATGILASRTRAIVHLLQSLGFAWKSSVLARPEAGSGLAAQLAHVNAPTRKFIEIPKRIAVRAVTTSMSRIAGFIIRDKDVIARSGFQNVRRGRRAIATDNGKTQREKHCPGKPRSSFNFDHECTPFKYFQTTNTHLTVFQSRKKDPTGESASDKYQRHTKPSEKNKPRDVRRTRVGHKRRPEKLAPKGLT